MDRSTKLILAAIAAGLWANAMLHLVSRPAQANEKLDSLVSYDVMDIKHDVHDIATGLCSNPRICLQK